MVMLTKIILAGSVGFALSWTAWGPSIAARMARVTHHTWPGCVPTALTVFSSFSLRSPLLSEELSVVYLGYRAQFLAPAKGWALIAECAGGSPSTPAFSSQRGPFSSKALGWLLGTRFVEIQCLRVKFPTSLLVKIQSHFWLLTP